MISILSHLWAKIKSREIFCFKNEFLVVYIIVKLEYLSLSHCSKFNQWRKITAKTIRKIWQIEKMLFVLILIMRSSMKRAAWILRPSLLQLTHQEKNPSRVKLTTSDRNSRCKRSRSFQSSNMLKMKGSGVEGDETKKTSIENGRYRGGVSEGEKQTWDCQTKVTTTQNSQK